MMSVERGHADARGRMDTMGTEEGALWKTLVKALGSAGIPAVVDTADGERHAPSSSERSCALHELLASHASQALRENRTILSSRDDVPAVAAAGLEWMVSVCVGAEPMPLAALTLYGFATQTLPPIPVIQLLAELTADAVMRQRERALLVAEIRLRERAMTTLAHDVRSSLAVVGMAAGVAGGDPTGAIQRHVKRMEMLVCDILETGVMSGAHAALSRAPCEPPSLVTLAVAYLDPLARAKDVRVRVTLDEPLPPTLLDASKIEQVLCNLLGNAVKFSPQGGVIETGCRAHPDGVAFFVRDQGPGVPAEHRARVFERYWRGDEGTAGSGLGLAIAHDIVQAHGGRIWVDGDPGWGATFTFTVPLMQPS